MQLPKFLSKTPNTYDRYFLALFALFLGITIILFLGGLAQASERQLVASAAAGAVTASFWAILVQARGEEEKRSEFYLNSFTEGVEQAAAMLGDENNNRVRWIAAGRILLRCEKLLPLITVPEHQRIVEIKLDEYRHRFSGYLRVRERGRSAAFFYGVDEMPLPEAAAASTRGNAQGPLVSDIKQLSETSIHAVWRFARFPADYDDPLGQKFTVEELHHFEIVNRPLYEYLDFEDHNMSHSGVVHRLEAPKQRKTNAQVENEA